MSFTSCGAYIVRSGTSEIENIVKKAGQRVAPGVFVLRSNFHDFTKDESNYRQKRGVCRPLTPELKRSLSWGCRLTLSLQKS
jgi:hypothetical protein